MNTIRFDLPKDRSSIIKVLGVGGGGGNAVNHMYAQGIKGVDFVICNTDLQALEASSIPNKVQLGTGLTAGLGAGANPEVGKKAAMEAIEDIIDILGVNTKMLFITAGMGGGTGTGAAPIIAKAARELDILTVGIVTTPFQFEGKKRKTHAEEGIEILKKSVDCLLVINNDKIKDMYGNLPIRTAFSHANDILTIAAKGIAEIITFPGYINVDFEDVKTVMQNSGVALMGSAMAEGEDRALKAVKAALASPLLNENQITGAKNILLNITSGSEEVLMDEIGQISSYIQDEAGLTADMILGTSFDESIGANLSVTIIATGFETRENRIIYNHQATPKTKHVLYEQVRPNEMIIIDSSEIIEPAPKPEVAAEVEPTIITHQLEPEETIQSEIQQEPEMTIEPEELRFELRMDPTPEDLIEDEIISELVEDEEIRSRVQDVIQRDQEIDKMGELIQEQVHFEISNLEAEINEPMLSAEEQEARFEKHIQRLKELKNLNVTIKSPNGIRDLEKEPAYIRKNKKLNDVPHSSESSVSRLSLFEDPKSQKTGIRTNNSFLHDNVD